VENVIGISEDGGVSYEAEYTLHSRSQGWNKSEIYEDPIWGEVPEDAVPVQVVVCPQGGIPPIPPSTN
jgi:hypothetical protein